MAKVREKLNEISNNPIFIGREKMPKSRQEINQENYQKNKEKLKAQQKINYSKKKDLEELAEKNQLAKYSQAENYKILISLKEYIELNSEKYKKWVMFFRMLKDLSEIGIHNISEIMRLCELGEILTSDYWKTAKSEIRKGKSWNSLDYDQQQKLIRYWGYEKARIKNNLLTLAEQLEKQSEEYLAEIELAKFHEEKGKVKCKCYSCSENKRLQKKNIT